MGAGLDGGTSFMEDYTYDLAPGGRTVLGAHMLEVCPSIAAGRPSCEIHPLSIGGQRRPGAARVHRGARARRSSSRWSTSATASGCSLNEVEVIVPPDEPLPKLPVARALWRPRPDLATAAEAWLAAGGPHHTVFTDRARHRGARRLRRDRRHRARRRSTPTRACATSRTSCAGTRPTTGSRDGSLGGTTSCASASSTRTSRSSTRGSSSSRSGTRAASTATAGVMAIKPSGVAYDALGRTTIVGRRPRERRGRVDGDAAAVVRHADAPRALPRASRTSAASCTRTRRSRPRGRRRGRELPCFGTTHADHFRGPVPVTRQLTADEIDGDYEERTGAVIVEAFAERGLDPLEVPAALVASHGPFAWGADVEDAVENAVALEAVAASAYRSLQLARRARRHPDGAAREALHTQARRRARTTGSRREIASAACRRASCGCTTSRTPSRSPARCSCGSAASGSAAPTGIGSSRAGSATPCCASRSSSATSSPGVVEAGPRAGERVVLDPAVPCGRCALCNAGQEHLCSDMRFAGHGSTDGALRTLVAWPGHLAHALPDAVADDAARCSSRSVWRCTRSSSAVQRATAAVFGCGPLGLLLVQAAAAAGVAVELAADPLAHRAAAARELGARSSEPAGIEVDVAYEAAGDDDALDAAIAAVQTRRPRRARRHPGRRPVVVPCGCGAPQGADARSLPADARERPAARDPARRDRATSSSARSSPRGTGSPKDRRHSATSSSAAD